MPGLRRLLDVGSKISGALGAPRAEGDDAAPPGAQEEGTAVTQAGTAPQATDAQGVVVEPPGEGGAPEPGSAPIADEPIPAGPSAAEPSAAEPSASASVETAPAGGEPAAAGTTAPTGVLPSQPDAVCAAAVDVARAAAAEVAGEAVGEHLGVEPEPSLSGEPVVTHAFAALQAGYRGWRWAVTVARAEGTDAVTVDEVVLLPGPGALLAPEWVPWSDRVQPGDLGPGDLLPPREDDPRVVPSYEDVDAERLPFDLHRDLGLGRPRVLSAEGRADAAQRWHDGPGGPRTAMARQAPAPCATCGFLVPLAGALGREFGVCANGLAPDDGRVVAMAHGCGAHSETAVASAQVSTAPLAVEHEELELVDVHAAREALAAPDA